LVVNSDLDSSFEVLQLSRTFSLNFYCPINKMTIPEEARPLQSVDGVALSIDSPNNDPNQGTKYDFPRDLIGYGRDSFDAQWPNGAKVAVSFVINYEEGAERSLLEGDSQTESVLWEQAHVPVRYNSRDPKIESDYEYGSRVGVWRLLNLFEKHKVPITAFAVGKALEKNPAVAKAFVDGGHEVASHGYR
jgi:hypothetical protein